MTRIKRGFVAKKRRKKVIKLTEGFVGSHSRLFKTANQQNMRSLRYSYFDRRKKKSMFKQLWIKRINAASRILGINYSTIVNRIRKKNILLNKKMLSEIIINDRESFEKILKEESK